jgi:uncharacterized protein
MIHPATSLIKVSETVGVGVVATEPIPVGTITWVRDRFDQLIDERDVHRLTPLLRSALLRNCYSRTDRRFVLAWDDAKYMNHSCEPNVAIIGGDVEIAVRDIAVGEQLTNDYATMNIEEDEPFVCSCGSRACRRTISPVDAVILAEHWNHATRAALSRAEDVAQPLRDLLEPTHESSLRSVGRRIVITV